MAEAAKAMRQPCTRTGSVTAYFVRGGAKSDVVLSEKAIDYVP